jgi:hypothetical protein
MKTSIGIALILIFITSCNQEEDKEITGFGFGSRSERGSILYAFPDSTGRLDECESSINIKINEKTYEVKFKVTDMDAHTRRATIPKHIPKSGERYSIGDSTWIFYGHSEPRKEKCDMLQEANKELIELLTGMTDNYETPSKGTAANHWYAKSVSFLKHRKGE